MQMIAEINLMREQILQWRSENRRIAFIPTVGHIHEGHISLIRKARENADIVVISISVKPPQFDKSIDLTYTPESLDNDMTKLSAEGVDLLFTPPADFVPQNSAELSTFVDVPGLFNILEGTSKPAHFKGIATTLIKLFNIIQPDVAIFSEKNYQQLIIINKLVNDLSLPIDIISIPTVREMDGLALSRNNCQLTVDERQRAPVLSKTLRWINSQMRAGRNDYSELVVDGRDQLRAAGLEPDEIYIRDAQNLQSISDQTTKVVILAAAFIGQVRLIDNLTVDITPYLTDDSEE